jgi:hypothetical protein
LTLAMREALSNARAAIDSRLARLELQAESVRKAVLQNPEGDKRKKHLRVESE